jgi:hypothetical protein
VSSPATDQHLPTTYCEITDPDYAQHAAHDNFVLDLAEPGLPILRGRCPRCHGSMTFLIVDDVYKSVLPVHRQPSSSHIGRGSSEDPGIPVICTCEQEHSGRPADAEGCGAYWRLRIGLEAQ